MAEELENEQATPSATAEPEAPTETAVETPAPAPEQAETPAPASNEPFFWGTGRRKKAVARVRVRRGTGQFTINKRKYDEYFPLDKDRQAIMSPLEAGSIKNTLDIWVNVQGGGPTGQAGAVSLGLARAIAKALPEAEPALRSNGLLTRDARMSERKKYGQKGARKRFQFSKR